MPPKVDYGEAIAALTAQIQDLKTTIESNSSTINAIQSKMEKFPFTPPFAPIPVPPTTPTSAAGSNSSLSNYQAKPPRFNLTHFDGTDPQSWIFQAEQYFQLYAIPAQQKLTIASFFMIGEPLTWFQWMFRNHQLTDWPSFARALELRFSPSGHTKPQMALFKLRQTSTVAQYQKNFEILANRVQGLTDEHLMNLFVSGLKPAIQQEVVMFKPTTHYQALELAFMAEAKISESIGPSYRVTLPSSPRPSLAFPAPPRAPHALSPSFRPPLALPAPPSQPPIKRLTPAEMQARRAKGLCYNCDDQYKPGHKCRSAPFLLLQIEEDDDEASGIPISDGSLSLSLASLPLPPEPQLFSESDPNDFQVSLHALYGQSSLNTLKLLGNIVGYQFTVLVDSGSTHNLIQPRLAQFLQLPIEPALPLTVTVGNGDTLRYMGQVTNLPVGLQGHEFLLDLYLLEVRGADIILGIQWLSQFGPMLADFANLSLTFVHQDAPTCHAISGPVMSFLDQLKLHYATDSVGKQFMTQVHDNPASHPNYRIKDGLLFRLGKIVIPEGHELQNTLGEVPPHIKPLPVADHEGQPILDPEHIIRHRIVQHQAYQPNQASDPIAAENRRPKRTLTKPYWTKDFSMK
ncbi:Retrotransposon gag protein [Corchorus olitorius]|uniref:Retrotransposon gag protein n=1 Tax=Corchorus olitorius TaxID=93759 RepID=A0A1R3JZ49_9ROSI|nr:Retrotransposon gag protein [Corchorus olitorius]